LRKDRKGRDKVAEIKSHYQKINDEVVKAKTGKSWGEWHRILDEFGRKEKGHRLTARHLEERYGLSGWWSQVVTIRYEWDKGLRTEVMRDEK